MNKKVLQIGCALLVGAVNCFLFQWTAQAVHAADTVRVVIWNTQNGTPKGSCPEAERGSMLEAKRVKVENMANYLVAVKPDIALLQEIVTNCGMKEEEMLSASLASKGYPMDYHAQSVLRGHMNVVTFSRLPIKHDSVREVIDDTANPARAFLVVPIQVGGTLLETYNVHIRAGDPQRCTGVVTLWKDLQKHAASPILTGGDFNLAMLDKEHYSCAHSVREGFTTEYTFMGNVIDFALVERNGAVALNSVRVDVHSPSNDHKALVAEVAVGGGGCANNPDVSSDGMMSIFDYNALLSVFGTRVDPGSQRADINCSGMVDIFDYNLLLEALAKY